MVGNAPSGRQHTIVYGDQRAVIVEVGGGLRSYVAGGREVLDGYGEDEMATAARGHPLIPWPNRVRDGRYTWDGTEHQLPLTEPEKGNAIHGLVRWASWRPEQQRTDLLKMRQVVHPQPGYPFTLEVSLAYLLDAEGLTVTTVARNIGDSTLPYAAGQHPYLAASGLVDECTLELSAAAYLITDDRGLPRAVEAVAETDYDFRAPKRLGDIELDTAFTDLARDDHGRAWVTFTTASGQVTRLWADASYRYIELFTGDSLPDRGRRRRGLGVEPMTAPPNALHDQVDVVRLEPGQSATSRWGVTVATP